MVKNSYLPWLPIDWIPRGQNDKRTALAWFFAKISLENDEARRNKDVIAIAAELTKVGCGDHLQTILGGNAVVEVSLTHIRDTQMDTVGVAAMIMIWQTSDQFLLFLLAKNFYLMPTHTCQCPLTTNKQQKHLFLTVTSVY